MVIPNYRWYRSSRLKNETHGLFIEELYAFHLWGSFLEAEYLKQFTDSPKNLPENTWFL